MQESHLLPILKRAILFLAAIVVGLFVLFKGINVLLLGFAALLFAIFLYTACNWISKKTHLSYPLVLSLFFILFVSAIALLFWTSAPLISTQLSSLFKLLSDSYTLFLEKTHLNINWHNYFKEEQLLKFVQQAGAIFTIGLGALLSIVIFLIVGFYLALRPGRYVQGVVLFFPNNESLCQRLFKIGRALQYWLMGKLIGMLTVALMVMAGLALLGVPLAFILGVIAGLLTFIPFLGAIASAIPATLIALTISPLLSLYVILLFLAIHLVEGYFIVPYIEQKTVRLPPALTIMTQLLFTVLFGFLGLALATPLLVVILSLVSFSSQASD